MAYLRTINSRTPKDRRSSVNRLPPDRNGLTFTGRVKWFNKEKGYGFIVPDDGSPDVFVHIKTVQRSGLHFIEEGQGFEYEVSIRPDGRTVAERLRQI